MSLSQSRAAIAHDPDSLADVSALLERYPEVSVDERDRIGRFLRSGAPIDIGLLSSNAGLWRTADRFKFEHPHYFKVGAGVYAGWAAAVAALVGTLVLIKDAGMN